MAIQIQLFLIFVNFLITLWSDVMRNNFRSDWFSHCQFINIALLMFLLNILGMIFWWSLTLFEKQRLDSNHDQPPHLLALPDQWRSEIRDFLPPSIVHFFTPYAFQTKFTENVELNPYELEILLTPFSSDWSFRVRTKIDKVRHIGEASRCHWIIEGVALQQNADGSTQWSQTPSWNHQAPKTGDRKSVV
jgi:hypothetical protein